MPGVRAALRVVGVAANLGLVGVVVALEMEGALAVLAVEGVVVVLWMGVGDGCLCLGVELVPPCLLLFWTGWQHQHPEPSRGEFPHCVPTRLMSYSLTCQYRSLPDAAHFCCTNAQQPTGLSVCLVAAVFIS